MTEKVGCGETDSSISGFSHCVVFITYGPWYVRFRLLGVYRSNNTKLPIEPQSACATLSTISIWTLLWKAAVKLNQTTLFSQLKSPSNGKVGLYYTLLCQSWVMLWLLWYHQCSWLMVTQAYWRSLLCIRSLKYLEHMYSMTLWQELILTLKIA